MRRRKRKVSYFNELGRPNIATGHSVAIFGRKDRARVPPLFKSSSAAWKKTRPKPGDQGAIRKTYSLLKQCQYCLLHLVSLGQHGSRCLLDDLRSGQLSCLARIICIGDTTFGSNHVIGYIRQVK